MAFSQVAINPIRLHDYHGVAPSDQIQNVLELGASLSGARVAHINSTAVGGGVAEILKSMVPLMSDSGLDTRWLVIEGSPEFFEITKRMHNLLQGAEGVLSDEEMDFYLRHNQRVAEELMAQGVTADVWVLHDPQSLPLASFLPPDSRVVWVCHIDTTKPNKQVMQQLTPLMKRATRVIFSLPEYVVPELDADRVCIAPPAIDPLTPKNREPELDSVKPILSRLGLDTERPIVAQVARFDLWKDPWGVIDAYRLVKREVPELQLALLGVIDAMDDPEAFSVLESVRQHAGGDPDIHLFSDPLQVSQPEVAAFQKGSDVIIQKSLREGFGLSVAEALWKGTPVIGGNCGGIRIQIDHGETGYLVNSVEECAQAILSLLKDPEKGRRMGDAARERVRQRFLIPRLLADYMSLFKEILSDAVVVAARESPQEVAMVASPDAPAC